MTRGARGTGVGAAGAALLVALAACGGDQVTTPSNARVVASFRATQLAVGDTMTVRAGVRYQDGRFTPLDGYTVESLDPVTLLVRPGTTMIEGRAAGAGRLRVQIPEIETTIDTTIDVVP